ncbi:OstA-like protein [Pontibacter sp. G13]|uniref:OstA-like protein n=1 Tax=Pontibacter sp. G13 TaxID=3074898 RepID=UPI00288B849A|nr:OstA-like protein [Pontibacter sp. G13]WNJ18873.1 OstA-like protein [Pontibacter sp. G13]
MSQRQLFRSFVFLLLAMSSVYGYGQTQPKFGQLVQSPQQDSTKTKRIQILYADRLSFEKVNGQGVQKLIGKVRLKQDSTLFMCDSAYLFDNPNRVEAYNRVRVIMSDSIHLYGDKLVYDGETKIADVYGNILLTDQQSKLTTSRLTYHRNEDYGYYDRGGKLQDDESVLTSITGHYYPRRKMAYFRNTVELTHPDYTLSTDTLGYNTEEKIAYFMDSTVIDSKDGKIFTTEGFYRTQESLVFLVARSTVKDSAFVLEADTLEYIDSENIGYARGNVLILDEDSSLEVRGGYGVFNRQTDESRLTQNPVVIQFMEEDTLYMFSDTLFYSKKVVYRTPIMEPDSSELAVTLDSTVRDSLAQLPDFEEISEDLVGPIPPEELTGPVDTVTLRRFIAYPNVRFFMNDMQGWADSVAYMYDDSTLHLFQTPVLWSGENQMTGDTIHIWMKNKTVDSMWVGANGFLVSEVDTVGFNQVKGRELRATFRSGELKKLHVVGNSESIYFIEKDNGDSTITSYEGMNQTTSQDMFISLENNEVVRIRFLSKPVGEFKPIFDVIFQQNQLDGMNWRIEEKPVKPVPASIFGSGEIAPISNPSGLPAEGTLQPEAFSLPEPAEAESSEEE